MKRIILLSTLFSFLLRAEDISQYRYYAKSLPYIAYIKEGDQCIYAGYIKNQEVSRYCSIGNSSIQLDTNIDPNVYASEFMLSGASLYFFVSAYWDSKKCILYIPKKRLTCENLQK